MSDIIRREVIYLWYYFSIQFRQIFWYWVLGMVLGAKRFGAYLLFIMAFSLMTGLLVNIVG